MLELAYIAGILDGEGTITIVRGKGRQFMRAQISIVNTNKELCDLLKEHLGWRVNILDRPGRRRIYQLYCREDRDKVKEFLESVLPYLIVKRENAEVVLEFIKTLKPKFNNLNNQLTPEDIATRIKCFERIQSIKGRHRSPWKLGQKR